MKIKILVADDHLVVRAGLRFLMEKQEDMEILGEAGDGQELVRLAEELNPSVIVMDIAMPRLNGIEAASQVLHRDPNVKIIILSMYADQEFIVHALAAGAKGYLLKDAVEADLVRAVRAVATDGTFFSPAVARALAENYVRQLQSKGKVESCELLTDRERELLQLLAEGKSDKLLSEQNIQASIEMALSAHQSELNQRAVPTIVEGIKQRRNALDLALHVLESVNWGMVTGKRRGRPKGSKNKPKLTAASLDG
jgi:DNA-binding NarL/FixJ family response regulator